MKQSVRGTIDVKYDREEGEMIKWVLCFFFQAEDGIRDLTLTGVQTCALPISRCWLPTIWSSSGSFDHVSKISSSSHVGGRRPSRAVRARNLGGCTGSSGRDTSAGMADPAPGPSSGSSSRTPAVRTAR